MLTMTKPQVSRADVPSEQLQESIDVGQFRSAFRLHPAGVSVVTTDVGGVPMSMTVSSLTSVSAEPPIVSVSLTASSYATPAFVEAASVVVHLLGADQLRLAQLGATGGVDRFADPDSWSRLATGEPVYRDTYSWLRGKVIHQVEAGSSVILLLHVVEAYIPDDDGAVAPTPSPLVYHSRTWHQLGEHSEIA